jgi:hypothetical protein
MDEEPFRLQLLRDSMSILSTDFLGALDEDGMFSYAYTFTTNQVLGRVDTYTPPLSIKTSM